MQRRVLAAMARRAATVLRFAAVGAVTTLLDFALFTFAVLAGTTPVVANLGSYSCGIALSYALNRLWTFGAPGDPRQAARFVAATLAGLGLSTLLVGVLSEGLPAPVAKAISVPIVFVWNYLTARHWVFRPSAERSDPPDLPHAASGPHPNPPNASSPRDRAHTAV